MAAIRVGLILDTAGLAGLPRVMADRAEFRATVDRATADRVDLRAIVGPAADRAMVARGAHLAMAVAAAPVAADTMQRRVVVDITPVAGTPQVVVDTPAAAVDILVVAAIPVAEVIAKKLGDSKSLREAAT
jgi:hypothetical protein